jgi:MoxR-like ATPase
MDLKEYFRGDGVRRSTPPTLPPSVSTELEHPSGYRATPPVKAAVNVAINLGLPLLITGDPGVGKSTLARAIAYELNFNFIEFVAKSMSSASDLLYRFDAVRHFRDAQIIALSSGRKAKVGMPDMNLAPYIRFEGLGRAIALTYPRNDPLISTLWDDDANTNLAAGGELSKEATFAGLNQPRLSEGIRSIVLIDEIDKAPRDVPNDLLVEIERRSYRVAESGARLSVQGDLWPIVIITSNSEKSLPDAFLRRCVFHHIEFPNHKELAAIIESRISQLGRQKPPGESAIGLPPPDVSHLPPLGRSAIGLLSWLRPQPHEDRVPLRKPPSVAELLSWLRLLLQSNVTPDTDLRDAFRDFAESALHATLGVLIKDRADMQRVLIGDLALANWAAGPRP